MRKLSCPLSYMFRAGYRFLGFNLSQERIGYKHVVKYLSSFCLTIDFHIYTVYFYCVVPWTAHIKHTTRNNAEFLEIVQTVESLQCYSPGMGSLGSFWFIGTNSKFNVRQVCGLKCQVPVSLPCMPVIYLHSSYQSTLLP